MLPPELTEELHYLELAASRRIRNQRLRPEPQPLSRHRLRVREPPQVRNRRGPPPRGLERLRPHAGALPQTALRGKGGRRVPRGGRLALDEVLDRQVVEAHPRPSRWRRRWGSRRPPTTATWASWPSATRWKRTSRRARVRRTSGGSSTGSTTCETRSTGPTARRPIRFLRSRLRRMAIVFLLSDFIIDPDAHAAGRPAGLQGAGPQARCGPDCVRGRVGAAPANGPRAGAAAFGGRTGELLLSLSSGQRTRFEALVNRRKAAVAGPVLFARHGLPVSAGGRTLSGPADGRSLKGARKDESMGLEVWRCVAVGSAAWLWTSVRFRSPRAGHRQDAARIARGLVHHAPREDGRLGGRPVPLPDLRGAFAEDSVHPRQRRQGHDQSRSAACRQRDDLDDTR